MTTPEERTRNIIQAGAFLKELCYDDSLPEHVRAEAMRLLRHYPTLMDVRMMASMEHPLGFSSLTTEFDPQWLEGYALGAHRE